MYSEGDNMPNKIDQKANIDSVGCGSNQFFSFFFMNSRQFTKTVGVALYPESIYYKNTFCICFSIEILMFYLK